MNLFTKDFTVTWCLRISKRLCQYAILSHSEQNRETLTIANFSLLSIVVFMRRVLLFPLQMIPVSNLLKFFVSIQNNSIGYIIFKDYTICAEHCKRKLQENGKCYSLIVNIMASNIINLLQSSSLT